VATTNQHDMLFNKIYRIFPKFQVCKRQI